MERAASLGEVKTTKTGRNTEQFACSVSLVCRSRSLAPLASGKPRQTTNLCSLHTAGGVWSAGDYRELAAAELSNRRRGSRAPRPTLPA